MNCRLHCGARAGLTLLERERRPSCPSPPGGEIVCEMSTLNLGMFEMVRVERFTSFEYTEGKMNELAHDGADNDHLVFAPFG